MGTGKAGKRFPLWWHKGAKSWCKKVRGQFHYFGTDKAKALDRWKREGQAILDGEPSTRASDELTLAELVNQFLNARRLDVEAGELTARTWAEYHGACERVVKTFGRDKGVTELRPADFGLLRSVVAKNLGPVALHKFITLTKTIFKFGFTNDLIELPVKFGDRFKKPKKPVIRAALARRGRLFVAPADLWKLLAAADVQVRAMLYLSINCAFGAKDCSDLNRKTLAERAGWIDALRGKTSVRRVCPLWPETVEAIAAVEKVRPKAANKADADAVFLTARGNRWCRFVEPDDGGPGVARDAAYLAFSKVAKKAGVKVPGGLYVLRHTFRNVADRVKDQPAAGLIMGHSDESMAGRYRGEIGDDRLEAVTNHVRLWLLAAKPVG